MVAVDLSDAVAGTQARLDALAPEGLWVEVWDTSNVGGWRLMLSFPCGRVFCVSAKMVSGDASNVFELVFPRQVQAQPRVPGGPTKGDGPWACLWDGADIERDELGVFGFQSILEDGRPAVLYVRLWPGGDGLLRQVPAGARAFVSERTRWGRRLESSS